MSTVGGEHSKAAFIYDSELDGYPYPSNCPFNTGRAGLAYRMASSTGLLSGPGIHTVTPVPSDSSTLEKFHTRRYLDALRRACSGFENIEMGIGTVDCPSFDRLYEGAALAAGATLTGVDLLVSGGFDVAFNPSGGFHHAMPERAAGFCYINDVALACEVLTQAGRRVLYLDVDVHFGDGVAYGFYRRSDVLTISLHQDGRLLFPGTGFADEIGEGPGRGYCVNIPLPPGTYDNAYIKAFTTIVPPLAAAFKPDAIVFELGADALAGDPLAQLSLTNNVYAEIIGFLLGLGKPIIATGGGGYNIENTVRAWTLAWKILSGLGKASGESHAGLAVGGVLMESTEWAGGLRDRAIRVDAERCRIVDPAVDAVIEKIQATVFPLHGLSLK